MESTTTRAGVDLSAQRAYPGVALALALLSVPGSTLTWDLFDPGGFVIGLPLAIAAIVLGVRARRAGEGRGLATAAVIIAGVMIAQMAVWTIVESL
jgi:peptidoglycan/LPS O-acetylase OafA/YrhL